MLLDSRQLAPHQSLDCDICVVGTGAAGITLAVRLASSGARILLIESGGFVDQTHDQFDGDVDADAYHLPLRLSRRRIFGGTTTVWAGRCVPLEEIDFERRDYMPFSGWPISREELLSHYERASQLCEAGEFNFSVARSLGPTAGEVIPGLSPRVWNSDALERYSCPTNFGRRYENIIRHSPQITMVYHATCTLVRLRDDAASVQSVTIKSPSNDSFTVVAKRFVLAMGCLETTRLMLASSNVAPRGIGNHSNALGRFYMCHIESPPLELSLRAGARGVVQGYERTHDGVYCQRRLEIRPDVQRQNRIGNVVASFYRPCIADPQHKDGILSAIYLTKRAMRKHNRLYLTAAERRVIEELGLESPHTTLRHLQNVAVDAPRLIYFLQRWVRKRLLAYRKLPPVIPNSRNRRFRLVLNAEQSPEPDNRVTLTDRLDDRGVPRLHVLWRLSDVDRRTIKISLQLLRDELRSSECGEIRLTDEEIEQAAATFNPIGGHHMGTTRMSDDPAEGVVDRNCRVHGVDNLFVAGSGVFPTSGHANPTLTIVALANRLADHLQTHLQTQPGMTSSDRYGSLKTTGAASLPSGESNERDGTSVA